VGELIIYSSPKELKNFIEVFELSSTPIKKGAAFALFKKMFRTGINE
jgi:hypothetical protein